MRHGQLVLWTAGAVLAVHAAAPTALQFRNTGPDVEYAGSKACGTCHPAIFRTYMQTGMGRSVRPAVVSDTAHIPATVHASQFNRDFQVYARDGQVIQSEAERNSAAQIFEQVYKLEYAIGSGQNGITYAVRRGDYLFQAPLSFYSKLQAWDLSPGYESTGEGFGRPIYESCIVCHSGRPQPVPGRDGLYRNPPFAEAAVGCENCHGPGALHIRERQKGSRSGNAPDLTIVNPVRLSTRLADDICMKCHQGGAARVLLPGRSYADFRPGTPLIETVAIFDLPRRDADSDLLEHHDSMKLSKCYRASSGRLSCITCHNPHQQLASDAAPDYYRKRCLKCHDAGSCKLSVKTRRDTRPADNCIGCHMQKRAVEKISHSVLTDHRIPIRPGAATRPQPPQDLDMPGLMLLNRTAGQRALPTVTKLAAYGELTARDASLQPLYLQTLDQASHESPNNPVVLAALGRKLLSEERPEALDLLTRAEATGSATYVTYLDLSQALSRSGRESESLSMLEKGESLFPYSRDLRKHLILAYIKARAYTKAQTALERYVSDFPEDSFMRGLLIQSKSTHQSVTK